MCDAVSYAAKNGVERRALPVDLPPREAAYAFFERRNGRGLPAELVRRLRELLRQHQGRAAQPTACIVDSQIVKARDTVAGKTSGYHGGNYAGPPVMPAGACESASCGGFEALLPA
jgi:transposase